MKFFVALIALAIIGSGIYYVFQKEENPSPAVVEEEKAEELDTNPYEVIGYSIEEREIQAHRFGTGKTKLVYVGALHGGYEWNTALLSYKLIDHLTANPDFIPSDIEVIVIPVANPDGLYKVLGTSERFLAADAPQFDFASEVSLGNEVVSGRFNAKSVDLNRNFDCKWQPQATWGSHSVGAGTAAFSEPEAMALRNFFLEELPSVIVFFHSASNGVFASFCNDDALPGTVELLEVYSRASGYPPYNDYAFYEVTGDAADWLSTKGIPAITVELSTHDVIEWEKNLAGIEAMLELYSEI